MAVGLLDFCSVQQPSKMRSRLRGISFICAEISLIIGMHFNLESPGASLKC